MLTAEPTPVAVLQADLAPEDTLGQIPTPKSAASLTETPKSPETPQTTATPTTFRDVSLDLFSRGISAAYGYEASSSVEDVLEKGLLLSEASPVHIVVRGRALEHSLRCGWRGIARTAQQREDAIRFWLGKADDEPLPSAGQIETEFMSHVNQVSARYRDFVAASFISIARGGLSADLLILTCYADYEVSGYLLGTGMSKLTVAYDGVDQVRSYDLYSRSHAAGEFGPAISTPLMARVEYEEVLEERMWRAEAALSDIVEGHESVLFLAPMGAHYAIAVEAWQVVAQWDMQRGDDGIVNAVRYGAGVGDPEHIQPLHRSRITHRDLHGVRRLLGTADRKFAGSGAVLPGHWCLRGHHAGRRVHGHVHARPAAACAHMRQRSCGEGTPPQPRPCQGLHGALGLDGRSGWHRHVGLERVDDHLVVGGC